MSVPSQPPQIAEPVPGGRPTNRTRGGKRPRRWLRLLGCVVALAAISPDFRAAEPLGVPVPGFKLSLWAREPMVADPVALSFDDQGRLYLVETARRSTVDIDIRSHQSWLVDDLANQSIDDLRRFIRSHMAPELSADNASWLPDLNKDGSHDWRDMLGVKERVRMLQDTKGAGRADWSVLVAEGFNEEVSGVIAGVMPWEDSVLVTVYPDLWRLRDLDGDGVADSQESLFRGFGVHAAFDGHDLHGLTIGPEGKIYFSNGDNGFSVVNREGRKLHYPNTGGVLRMNPDGSDLEVFATGLRNPQEIAFDEFGNLFTVDNDGDLEDERERFVFIAEGSDSGWRLHWQFRDPGWSRHTHQPSYNPWIAEKMWVPHYQGQPAHITPPLSNYSVGPGGFNYNPGTALNEAYQRHFFLVQFPVKKVTAFQTRPKGASFEMVNEHVFLSGMMASAVNFSPDGAMYVADWDGMWAPDGKGAVWLLDDPAASGSPIRLEVKRLLAEGMKGRKAEELDGLLGHADQRIRLRAQFELVRRKEQLLLLATAQSTTAPLLARVHALWGLGQSRARVAAEKFPFRDADAEIRAQSAKVAGDLRQRDAVGPLITLLEDANARVRYHAAMALGKIGDAKAIPGLVRLLESNRNEDAVLRHGAVMGLTGIGQAEPLAKLSGHASSAVRLGAVVALRRMHSPAAARFLADRELVVRREASRAVHDDLSIPEALEPLAALAEERDTMADETIARRALNANLRLGTEAAAQRLLRFAIDANHAEWSRTEAVECLGAWDDAPHLDRVEGLVRPLGKRTQGLGPRLLAQNLPNLLGSAGPNLAQALTRVVTERKLATDPAVFVAMVESTTQPPLVRAGALELLVSGGLGDSKALLTRGIQDGSAEVRMRALKLGADREPALLLAALGGQEAGWTLPERQLLRRLSGRLKAARAAEFVADELDALNAGKLPAELAVDVLEAARARQESTVKSRLAAWEKSLPVNDPMAPYRPSLKGGDPVAGREVFRANPNAQCVRCHEAGGDGAQAGPVLAGIAGRVNADYLLESLIDPSKQLAPGFATVSVETRDGEELDGTVAAEKNGELTLRLSSGESRTIPVSKILKRAVSGVSMMPPMGTVLTPLELRDVLAYLQSLK